MPIGTKYAPLAVYLAALPAEMTTVTLTLMEIEAILGKPLPRAAGIRMWWTTAQKRGPPLNWPAVGWQVTQAMMRVTPVTITFTRIPIDTIAPPHARGCP